MTMITSSKDNIANVSWGDHVVFGEGDGLLHKVHSLERRMDSWRDELNTGIIHWRQMRSGKDDVYRAAPGFGRKKRRIYPTFGWDEFEMVPKLAHERSMEAFCYFSLLDHGTPLREKSVRERSHHNPQHGRNFSRMSRLTNEHPEYLMQDRDGNPHWGVVCLAYPEVRQHMINLYTSIIDGYSWDGIFVCLRSQSRPADYADQYGFNEPVRKEFLERYGKDILREEFDVQAWRDLHGDYVTTFFRELSAVLKPLGLKLAVGCARGEVLGPPLSNTTLQWRTWLQEGIVDDLVIDQSSSQCPSLWIQLWPMHRGYGYTQNYLDGWNMASLEDDLAENYKPIVENSDSRLFLSRQWNQRDGAKEASLLSRAEVSGLAFSAFRHDNPGPVARDTWLVPE